MLEHGCYLKLRQQKYEEKCAYATNINLRSTLLPSHRKQQFMAAKIKFTKTTYKDIVD